METKSTTSQETEALACLQRLFQQIPGRAKIREVARFHLSNLLLDMEEDIVNVLRKYDPKFDLSKEKDNCGGLPEDAEN
jgi:hypothetical protein